MNFIYYAPARTRPDLRYAFDGNPIRRDVLAKGPDGGAGTILFDHSMVANMSAADHRPDVQTWRKIPGSDAWVGYYNENKPKPDELARKEMIRGHDVKLPDGNLWTIPVCRQFQDTGLYQVALPQTMDLDESGEWVVDAIVAKHQRLWDASCEWFDFVTQQVNEEDEEDEPIEVMVTDVADSCAIALATNYRVSKVEVAMLQLLTSTSRADIMNATIDLPAVEDQLKKKERAGGSGLTRGVKVQTPATIPA